MYLRSTIYNLVGLGGPLIAAVFTIPYLMSGLGVERFGLLTLIWAVVSYFGLFDLGLGRALTQQVVLATTRGKDRELPALIGTAYLVLIVLGIFASVILVCSAGALIDQINSVQDYDEVMSAMLAMSVAMPFIVLTSGFRGVLEARQAFLVLNLIRIPLGLFTFLGPAAVVWLVAPKLDLIAWILVFGRILACVVHGFFAFRVMPKEVRGVVVSPDWIKPLCVTGGWLTVSNVISPFMGYIDRFMVGALISAAAVSYYATPNEIVTKLWIIPAALTAVLFPAFSAQMERGGREARKLYWNSLFALSAVMAPIAIIIFVFSRDILSIWINDGFAEQSYIVLKIFAVGIFLNSLAHVPFTLIQSSGNPRLTALVHVVELPFFLLCLWWLSVSYGVEGAACAWLLRVVLDTFVMFLISSRVIRAKENKEVPGGAVMETFS